MQGLLSFENSPPLAAPLRFFLTAPLFAVLAGLLLAVDGPDLLLSRWLPATLAATHLLTIGFMLQVMLGALIQILPVVAGANLARPLAVSRLVHGGLSLGTLLLASGFYLGQPALLTLAAGVLGLAVTVFLAAAIGALAGVPTTSPTIRGLRVALWSLAVTVGLGMLLALALGQGWSIPLMALTDLHAAWGFAGWSGVLLAALACVVVPMFQLTPGYPARPGWLFPGLVGGWLLLWSAGTVLGVDAFSRLAQAGLALSGIAFALLTLRLQAQRRRARPDATLRYWQLGLASGIFALAMLLTVAISPSAADAAGWSLAFGMLLTAGVFLPFIIGMLYKIVPFLAWLHLQSLGKARVAAPPMNRLLPDAAMVRQFYSYLAASAMLVLACLVPDIWARPAGLAFALSCGWLMLNLLQAVRRYRQAQRQLAAAGSGKK